MRQSIRKSGGGRVQRAGRVICHPSTAFWWLQGGSRHLPLSNKPKNLQILPLERALSPKPTAGMKSGRSSHLLFIVKSVLVLQKKSPLTLGAGGAECDIIRFWGLGGQSAASPDNGGWGGRVLLHLIRSVGDLGRRERSCHPPDCSSCFRGVRGGEGCGGRSCWTFGLESAGRGERRLLLGGRRPRVAGCRSAGLLREQSPDIFFLI